MPRRKGKRRVRSSPPPQTAPLVLAGALAIGCGPKQQHAVPPQTVGDDTQYEQEAPYADAGAIVDAPIFAPQPPPQVAPPPQPPPQAHPPQVYDPNEGAVPPQVAPQPPQVNPKRTAPPVLPPPDPEGFHAGPPPLVGPFDRER